MLEVKNGVLIINGVPMTQEAFVKMLQENPAAMDDIHDEMFDIMISSVPWDEQMLLRGELAVIKATVNKIENPIERAVVMSTEMMKFGVKVKEDSARRGGGPLSGSVFRKK